MKDLNVHEAALILRRHENTVRELTKKGILPDRRDNRGHRVFTLAELLTLLRRERDGRRIGQKLARIRGKK